MAVAERFFRGLSPGGFHRVRYFEWGAPDAEVVVCVHGLTRNAHDFDRLAGRLAGRYRVVTVDVVGRGGSDWLANPAHYTYGQYQADMNALLARLDVERVHWIGTSMGGLIGMLLAALSGTPIASLLLNDVGPFIPKAALQRIADYLVDARFSSLQEVERYLRTVLAPFGPLSDEDWAHLARHGHRVLPDGTLALAYDPGIADNVKKEIVDVNLWPFWDKVSCPTLVFRGAESDLLSAETAREMTTRGPRARVVTFPGVGHAPALMADDQIEIVAEWLDHSSPFAAGPSLVRGS
jgi:pimeloyl-ACP methyl ester carboxylesterase